MESVYLRYTSNTNEHYVSQEDYLNVVRPLIMKLRRCAKCEEYFDADNNPCVGKRICMKCLLKKHPDYHFLEVTSIDKDGEQTFAFLDPAGKVYTIHENHSDDLSEDILHTLKQNGFLSVPTEHTPFKSTEPVKLWVSKFKVYGDVSRNSVVVLNYSDTWEKHHFTFLLYKHGNYKELTKRGEGKVLYEKAVGMIEKTKRGSYYYIDGQQRGQIWDGDIYETIAKLDSMLYDLSLQFAPPVFHDDPSTSVSSENGEKEQSSPQVEEVNDTAVAKPKRGRPTLKIVGKEEEVSQQTEDSGLPEEQSVQVEQEETDGQE